MRQRWNQLTKELQIPQGKTKRRNRQASRSRGKSNVNAP
jgi:hypothetical protein